LLRSKPHPSGGTLRPPKWWEWSATVVSGEHVKRLDLHCPIAAELDCRISNPFILVPSERTVTALLNDVSPHASSLTRIIGDRVPISTDKPEVGLLLLPFDIQSLTKNRLGRTPMLAHQPDE